MEKIEIDRSSEIELECKCSECDQELDFSVKENQYSELESSVEPCTCLSRVSYVCDDCGSDLVVDADSDCGYTTVKVEPCICTKED